MDLRTINNNIAAGIRAMKKEPAAFLYIDDTGPDETFDLPDVLGIPVFHGRGLTCTRWGTDTEDCLFIPLGDSDSQITSHDRKVFAQAFCEGWPPV